MGTLVKIIMVLILVIIIANFLGVNLFALGKSALGLGENILPVVYSEVNSQARLTFESMEKDINKCLNSQDKNCKCKVDVEGYYQTHALWFEKEGIRLLNIKNIEGNLFEQLKDGKGVDMASSEVKDLNKYCNNNLKSPNEFNLIYFEDGTPIIFKDVPLWTKITKRGKSYKLHENYQLYKSNTGELCWITEGVDKSKLASLKEC